jgi:hypothetical protein
MASILTTTPIIVAAAQAVLFLGVLEEPQCRQEVTRAVRVLFAKDRAGWHELSQPNPYFAVVPTSWSVAFDGRSLGLLRTLPPSAPPAYPAFYSRDQLLLLADDSAPTVRDTARLFGGWCGQPKSRPLVVVSATNVADPAVWKPVTPDLAWRRRVFAGFRTAVGRVVVCPPGAEEPVDLRYSDRDLVVERAYGDRFGHLLVAVSLRPSLKSCDGPTDTAWWSNWFFLSGDSVRFLDNGMSLLDAGDYDADGQSEVLFWFSRYNEDGYTMFVQELSERLDYMWGYH